MSATKVAVVIGVGPGLGGAIAEKFAAEGFAVAIVARSKDKLDALAAKIEASKGKVLAIQADACDEAKVTETFATIRSTLGEVNVLVYNAATRPLPKKGILELSNEDFKTGLNVNCYGAFLAIKAVLPNMVQQKSGTILFTGATASVKGSAKFASFATGKFALRALAQSTAREFGPQGIHVSHIVVDGIINMPFTRAAIPQLQDKDVMSTSAMANQYWNLHKQDKSTWTFEIDLRPFGEKW